MERLPHEILIEVLSQLTTKDKFTLLSVSKAWNRAAKTCVFNSINVTDPEKLTSAMNYFEENANLGNQVIDVEISDCKNIYQYLFLLLQLFPNLGVFRWNEMYADVNSYDPKTNPTTGIWKKLEVIQTTETFAEKNPPIVELILSKYCPNVTQVYADFYSDVASDHAIKNHCIRILNSLKNAPQLSTLEFSHLHCAIKDLETLHQNTPNLNKLILSTDTEFSLPDTHTGVLEYAHLSHLEMTFFDSKVSDRYETLFVALFRYIGRKYKGLTYFSVACNMEHCDGTYLCLISEYFDLNAMEEGILPMFSRCPGLKYYNQMFLPFSNTIAGEMDRCGIQLSKAVFYVETTTMADQLETLSNSQQRLYIEDLTLYQIDEHDYEPMEWPASRLAQMVNLKKLWLQGNLDPLCITELVEFLKHLPQLEEFQIYNTAVYFTVVDSDLPILALKSLSISWLVINSMADLQIVDKIMETVLPVCPKLQKFDLGFEYKRKRKEIEIDHFTVTLDFTTLTELFQVRTPFVDGRRYYIDSPWTTGYFYQDDKNLVRTESFQPHEFYTTILLSRPVVLDGIIVPIIIDGELAM